MRIIAGFHRGRILKAPKGLATRPVLGKVREALFSILGDISGQRMVDLFAGTGAIGIEALSRGVVSLVSVDQSGQACRLIRENMAGVDGDIHILEQDVFRALPRFAGDGRTFDLIFADPPYDQGFAARAVREVAALGLLAERGLMAVTVRQNEILPGDADDPGSAAEFEQVFDRRYGDTRLVIYRWRVSAGQDQLPATEHNPGECV